jgi:hypothetical protein
VLHVHLQPREVIWMHVFWLRQRPAVASKSRDRLATIGCGCCGGAPAAAAPAAPPSSVLLAASAIELV